MQKSRFRTGEVIICREQFSTKKHWPFSRIIAKTVRPGSKYTVAEAEHYSDRSFYKFVPADKENPVLRFWDVPSGEKVKRWFLEA